MNEQEFRQRMYLYAVTAIGTFRIDLYLEQTTLTTSMIKIAAKPFVVDIPATAVVSNLDLTNHAAEVFQMDLECEYPDIDISGAESAAIAVINDVKIVTSNTEIEYNIIGANSKAFEFTQNLQNLSSVITGAIAKVIAVANELSENDIIANCIANSFKVKDVNIYSAIQQLLFALNMDITHAQAADFSLNIAFEDDNTDISMLVFAAALIELSIAVLYGIDLDATAATVHEYNMTINTEAAVNIVLTAMKYLTLGDLSSDTLGELGIKTLEQLIIRIH